MSCYEKAVDLLSRRPHFRRQLARKLAQRGFPAAEVDFALDRLRELNYLDDLATARNFVRQRQAREAVGRRRLQADLVRRGAGSEVIAQVLDEMLPGDDAQTARDAARRWGSRRGDAASGDSRAALARYLDRRGFSRHAILTVLEEVAEAEPDR